ncbi:MAG TPA: endo-1,4-beta-xylanase [Bacteroidales bacterium]|nr:endo-1,4-beta-xylanase [Bacteroidales bacterium]HPI68298.1 endo-1,4-beta-xylanase [Bacteroidales bacterium]HPR72870.1 endo-1,4-beta-xylanase [Bacteroidales bacterium]
MKTRQSTIKILTRSFLVISFAASIMLLGNCSGTGGKKPGEIDSTKGLKDFYQGYFDIGVAVGPHNIQGEEAELIKKHFNSITAENVMKPGPIHPEEDRYNWDDADKIVDFAQANGMKVRGHTLCWHNQTAPWMFQDENGNQVSKEVALARLKDHITTVVSRYKGKIYAWDVLNEVIQDSDSAGLYRETMWLKICGEEYISKIFQWAHEADPDALLVYNDYNTVDPGKRDRMYTMLKKLLDEGVPVHAVGLQGHWNISDPTEENLRAAIEKFASLGLKIQITELDVSIYSSRADTIDTGFTAAREQQQTDFYKMIFDVFRENKDVINSVTFWNVTDRHSWRDRRGMKVYPLLFDENMQPKKAFWEVVKF